MTDLNQNNSLVAGMLSFARSIQVTEGLFYATKNKNSNDLTPIEIVEKGVRGQTSHDGAGDKAGLSNPQTVEHAIIPQEHFGLSIRFSVRFMPFSLSPHSCDNQEVTRTYVRLAKAYRNADGFRELSRLYIWNLANARFAWRNRFQSDKQKVIIEEIDQGIKLAFNPLKLRLDESAKLDQLVAALIEDNEKGKEKLEELINRVAKGLSNDDNNACTIKVEFNAKMEPGQEVFPSQEYLRDSIKKQRENPKSIHYGKPLKVLASLSTPYKGTEIRHASMHSQKIGAAIRHIDTWHDDQTHPYPIAVNPFGGIQDTGSALRRGDNSFYKLRENGSELIAGLDKVVQPEEISPEAHFIMANLIRGGVFGKKKE